MHDGAVRLLSTPVSPNDTVASTPTSGAQSDLAEVDVAHVERLGIPQRRLRVDVAQRNAPEARVRPRITKAEYARCFDELSPC